VLNLDSISSMRDLLGTSVRVPWAMVMVDTVTIVFKMRAKISLISVLTAKGAIFWMILVAVFWSIHSFDVVSVVASCLHIVYRDEYNEITRTTISGYITKATLRLLLLTSCSHCLYIDVV
jgi:uncharacterized membrane protein